MQKRLLLDGCSFTYGLNLQRQETLEQHFIQSGYEVINLSRPGKSNSAIALDLYNNIDSCDVLVVGWSYSSRWYLKYHKHNIDLLASRENVELPHTLDSELIEQSYQELHRAFYSLFDVEHWNNYSDMLVDNTAVLATQHKKKTVFFSWEPRNIACNIFYPHVPASHRLPCGHLNASGTINLFNNLTHIIEQ
jgi:hypothetical protein